MARTDLERLVVQLSADVRGFEKAMARAQSVNDRAASKIEGRWRQSAGKLNGMFSGIGKGFGGGLLAGGLAGLVSTTTVRQIGDMIKSVANLKDASEKAGVSAEALQKLDWVGSQAGVDIEQLSSALAMLNKKVGEARTKGGALADIFKANNLTFSVDPNENLLKIADLIRNAKNEQDKALIGAAAFGKAYSDLLPVLNQGSIAIRRQGEEAEKAGSIIKNKMVDKADQFDDAWGRIWKAFSKQGSTAILGIATQLESLFNNPGFAKFIKKLNEVGGGTAFQRKLEEGRNPFDSQFFFGGSDTGAPNAELDAAKAQVESLRAELERLGNNDYTNPVIIDALKEDLAAAIAKVDELTAKLKALPVVTGSPVADQLAEQRGLGGGPSTVVPSKLDDAANSIKGAAKSLEEATKGGILDLIGYAEGTDKGRGYNETLGYGAFTGGPQNLTSMTLNEILALQKQMLAHPDNDFNSSAVGRYQIVSTTLRDLMKKMNLSGNELFSPGMQDQLASALYADRGPTPWEGMKNIPSANIAAAEQASTAELSQGTEALRARKTAIDGVIAGGQEQIASLATERQAMQLTTFEAEKLRFTTERMNELKAHGVAITPEVTAAVDQLATQYANEQVALEGVHQKQLQAAESAQAMAQAQQAAAADAQAMAGVFAGAFKGFISDIVHGKSVTEALQNALASLADQLLSMALNQLFSSALGGLGGGGGLLAGIFHAGSRSAGTGGPSRRVSPALFAGAPRYHQGGIAGLKPGEIPAILKRGEAIGPEAVEAAARRLTGLNRGRAAQRASAAQAMTVQNRIINTFDAPSFLDAALGTGPGQRAILNFITANPRAIKQALG